MPEIEPPTEAELEAMQRHFVRRSEQEGAVVRVDTDLGLTLVRGPGSGPDTTYAAMPRWTDEWADALAAVSERMRGEGSWPSILLCDRLDRPVGLDAELSRLGWLRVAGETVRWVGHASVVPHLDPMLRIEAVQPPSADTHEALERQIFGIGTDLAERRRAGLRDALEAGTTRAWMVWLGDEAVAVARLSQGDGVAGIVGVGVVEARRGQGYATLITTIATRAGMAVGNRLVWLSVDDDNAAATKVYDKLGFKRAFGWARWLLSEDPRPRS